MKRFAYRQKWPNFGVGIPASKQAFEKFFKSGELEENSVISMETTAADARTIHHFIILRDYFCRTMCELQPCYTFSYLGTQIRERVYYQRFCYGR